MKPKITKQEIINGITHIRDKECPYGGVEVCGCNEESYSYCPELKIITSILEGMTDEEFLIYCQQEGVNLI